MGTRRVVEDRVEDEEELRRWILEDVLRLVSGVLFSSSSFRVEGEGEVWYAYA